MKIFTKVILILALATSLFGQQPPKDVPDHPKKDSAEGQEPVSENFYKLAFTVYELDDGKRINQRNYIMTGKPNWHPSSLRIGTRVPIYTEDKKMQYVDAGLDIRCDLKEQKGGKLQADCDIGISSFIPADQVANSGSAGPSAPIMRTTRTSSSSLLTMGKPALVATVDDVNSAKRMQIEVTATKLD
jgi:hypothetical protein